ncbi:cyclophane-forming radical SAM peptide maturase AmcB [Lentzea sp. NPDC004789]
MDRAAHWLTAEPTKILLQPTSLCPLACTYCYLPERRLRQEMPPATARAIADAIPEHWRPIEVVWHEGEPLAIGRERFAELLDPFERLRADGKVQHKVQTGATLITPEWCELFRRYDIAVGVSIDGPRAANRHRVDRGGREVFDRVMAGIATLRAHDIPFTVLAVVTEEHTGNATEILDFIAGLGTPWAGLNIEAREAANVDGRPPSREVAQAFWRDVFAWTLEHPGLAVREVDSLLDFLAHQPQSDAQHDLIPTVAWNGDVVLLSPELLGYQDFVAGNVNDDSLPVILERAPRLKYVQDFLTGLERCKATCEFIAYCQGGHAANRYFEHGTFTATETEHCRTSIQAPVLALAELTSERTP